MMREIIIRTPLFPTEDVEKVRDAILNIFPDAEIDIVDDQLLGRAKSVERFAEILRDNKIRDAARSQILHGNRGGKAVFWLSKQVAAVGKVNFTGKNDILGSMEVQLIDDDMESLVNSIAPSTREPRENRI